LHISIVLDLCHNTIAIDLLHITIVIELLHITIVIDLLHITIVIVFLYITIVFDLLHIAIVIDLLHIKIAIVLLHIMFSTDVRVYSCYFLILIYKQTKYVSLSVCRSSVGFYGANYHISFAIEMKLIKYVPRHIFVHSEFCIAVLNCHMYTAAMATRFILLLRPLT